MSMQIERLSRNLPAGMDAALITSPVSRRYYTGFASSAGTLIVSRKNSWFIIDSRYYGDAVRLAGANKIMLQDKLYEQIGTVLRESRLHVIGVEAEHTTLSEYRSLQDRLPGIEFVSDGILSGLINRQRMSKSDKEIAAIREAQRIADETFSHIIGWIRPDMTEREIALEMEYYSRGKGSEGAAFPYIVAGGRNSSVPHAVPGGYRVHKGDFITMDFGCIIDGYCSDMTRTVALGRPDSRRREVYDLVLRAQLAAIKKIRAGAVCREVDRVARDIIDNTEFRGMFGHGLGHSIGLEVHEPPRFSPSCEELLPGNCVISVEPGVYLDGEFGVRIEDLVVVTEEGCEILAQSPKELLCL